MPALQTTYPENMPVGYAGMRANEEPVVLISRNVENAAIAMGAGVMQGTADHGCETLAAGQTWLGLAVRDQSASPEINAFAVGESARIATKGVFYVVAGGAVAAGDPVGFDDATGKFVTGGGVAVPNARFDSSGAADDLVLLRLSAN